MKASLVPSGEAERSLAELILLIEGSKSWARKESTSFQRGVSRRSGVV